MTKSRFLNKTQPQKSESSLLSHRKGDNITPLPDSQSFYFSFVNISDFEIYFTQYQYTTSGLHVLCAWRIFCVQFLGAYCVFTYKIFERGDASPEEPPNLELPDLLMLSQASLGSWQNAARSGAGKCSLVGISGRENNSNVTEIRETGCQDHGKGGRRESRERRMDQSFWKIKSCVPFQVEWNQNGEWRGDGSVRAGSYKHPKRVCRDVGVPSTIFYFCYFMFE